MSNQTCIREVDDACDCISCQQRRVIEGLVEELRKLREEVDRLREELRNG